MYSPNSPIFEGVVALLVDYGIGKVQLEILHKHVLAKGGTVSTSLSNATTHIFTKLEPFKCLKYLHWDSWKPQPRVHTLEWLTESIKRGVRAGESEYLLSLPCSSVKVYHKTPITRSSYFSNNDNIYNKRKTLKSAPAPKTTTSTYHAISPIGCKTQQFNTIQHTQKIHSPSPNRTTSTQLFTAKPTYESDDDNTRVTGSDTDQARSSEYKRKHASSNSEESEISFCSKRTRFSDPKYSNETEAASSDTTTSSATSNDTTEWISFSSFDEDPDFNSSFSDSLLSSTSFLSSSMDKSVITRSGHSNHHKTTSRTINQQKTLPIKNTDEGDKKKRNFTITTDDPFSDHDGLLITPPLSPIDPPSPVLGEQKISLKKLEKSNIAPKIDKRDILQNLEETAESTGDKWRAFAYRKATTILKNLPYQLTCPDHVKHVKGIGPKISEKIREIIETGKLRKIEVRDPMVDTFKMFSNVFAIGAGPETVKKWYAQGYRTLQDVARSPSLTHQQIIGIKYYQDFLQRIPREEVANIEAQVLQIAQALDSSVQLTTCGSYRRGKPDCGDIDILLSQVSPSNGFLKLLVEQLYSCGIITDHLTSSVVDKYMGVCKVGSHGIYRRLDLRLIPLSEWPCALLYFTGSDHFNRSMRLWARKHGYSLNEHALVQRWGRLNRYEVKGEPLAVTTEDDVFRILGLEYREPKDRDV